MLHIVKSLFQKCFLHPPSLHCALSLDGVNCKLAVACRSRAHRRHPHRGLPIAVISLECAEDMDILFEKVFVAVWLCLSLRAF